MEKSRVVLTTSALGLIAMFVLGGRMLISTSAQSRAAQVPDSIAAVVGQKGGQDIFGAYEPVANWLQDLSELPGNEKWTWGSVEGVFAESPNRVFIFQRGELPNIPVPKTRRTPEFWPSLAFPVGEGRVPMRNATTASPPAARSYLANLSDERATATWRLVAGGRQLFAAPRAAVLRSFLFNHWYHHRGQLLVYLRMRDVSVPSVYGPSADENPFAGA